MFTNRPAMRFIVPFSAGIILGRHLFLSFYITYAFLVAIVLLYFACKIAHCYQYHTNLILVLICFFFGFFKSTFDFNYKPQYNISNFILTDSIVTLKGYVEDDPDWSEYSIKFVVEAETLFIEDVPIKISGNALVSFKRNKNESQLRKIHAGEYVSINGYLKHIRSVRNPGEFDYGSFLNIQNIDVRLFAISIDTLFNMQESRFRIYTSFVVPVRRSLSGKIDKIIGGEEGRFLKGLLLGERTYIAPDIKNAFINAGVMHIVAVSGLHVVIVTFIILIILQILRVHPKFRLVFAGILLIYYALLTGWTPSVVRSVMMALIYFGSRMLERKTDIYNVVAISGIIILMIDSRQLFHAGFQLSYMAVLSIVYLYPRLNIFSKWHHDKNHFLRLLSWIWSYFAVSLSATIGTAPFVGLYFGKISIVGVIVNIIIVPLSNIILMIGMISIGFSYISTAFASYYAEVVRSLTTLLLTSVQKISEVPFAFIYVGNIYGSWIYFYIIVSIILMLLKKNFKRVIILSLVLMNVVIYLNIFSESGNKLRLTFLDVGQGDAIIIELPDGNNIVVDAGPRTLTFDSGNNVIIPYLRWRGVNRIDKLIITHPDADHVGGFSGLVRGINISEIIDGGITRDGMLSNIYCKYVDSLKLKRTIVNRGILFGDSLIWRMYFLNPRVNCLNKKRYDNSSSIVVKIVYGRTSILLTGDINSENEFELIKIFNSFLKSDILKLPHHGSRTSSSINFLKMVNPLMCIISVGENNRFNHPSPEVLERLQDNKYEFLRTDKEGALIFESDGKIWNRVFWR